MAVSITIELDPQYPYGLTPAIVGEAVQRALAFGTDDTLDMYEGADQFSAPLDNGHGTDFGFIHIR